MRTFVRDSSFKRQLKALLKKHYSEEKLKEVLALLASGQPLPGKYKDHALSGSFKGCRECHIEDNWLLIYILTDDAVVLVATGTHDDLFK